MPFGNLLQNKFDSMPYAVKVLTYLILLALTVYLYLAPRFVTGQIVARTDDGGFVPYRGAAIQTRVAGHVLKFTSNEDGYWAIPIVDRKPGGLTLNVFHEDKRSWFEVSVGAMDVWIEDIRIVVLENKPFFNLEVVEAKPAGDTWLAGIVPTDSGWLFAGSAQAGVLEYGKDQVYELDPKAEQAFRAQVFEEVRKVISGVTKGSMADLKIDTRLDREHGFGYVQRIQVVKKLESAYDITIYDEHWREFRTIGDLTDYIADRKDFEKVAKLSESLSKSHDWAEIQQAVPEGSKPKFIPRTTAKQRRYWVVVGSHQRREDADRQVKKINDESKEIRAFVGIKVPPNKYFPVIVGHYAPYPEAKNIKTEALKLEAVEEAYLSSGDK